MVVVLKVQTGGRGTRETEKFRAVIAAPDEIYKIDWLYITLNQSRQYKSETLVQNILESGSSSGLFTF